MRSTIAQLTCLVTVGAWLAAASASTSDEPLPRGRPQARAKAQSKPINVDQPALECGNVLSFQVLLDTHGFSPGQLDGAAGPNFGRALSAFQDAHQIAKTGQPDCATWNALGGESAGSATVSYTVTDDDVKGPFTESIPRELSKQASLPALGYRSVIETLAERFHSAPALLQRLNGKATFFAGDSIRVPAVQPFDPEAKPVFDPSAADLTIQVMGDESSVRATRPNGAVIFHAPVTTGSEHDPLPVGDWKVTSVDWHPAFNYNPDLFWDAKPADTKATIKPGPNNPVGVVWIGVSREHYGMHGTPEPGHVGHTESHGCVRLTNWDAARLAALVKPGTPVRFR